MDLIEQRGIGAWKRQFDIDARFERHLGGGLVRSGDVMNGAQLGGAEIIGDHHTRESPFMAQDVFQKVAIAVGGDAINFIVGGHDTAHVCFDDCGFKRFQEIFADDAFGKVSGSNICAALGLTMDSKVFCSGHHMRLVDARTGALQTLNGGNADSRDQVRIFAIGFFGAAPAGIAR